MNDTPTTPVSLAELARATDDLPFGEGNGKGNGAATPLMARAGSGMDDVPVGPTAEDIATLTTQYKKAVNGLYEAYLFGQMLLAVKARLEGGALSAKTQLLGAPGYADGTPAPGTAGISPRDATRGTAMEQLQNGRGWNVGTGLKAWLEKHCPEINYSTARRFLAVAEKTNAALILSDEASRAGEHPLPGEEGAEPPHRAPSEEAVRAYLEGKSQRQILKAPKATPAERHAPTPEERAERIRETFAGFLTSLEGMVRTEETNVLRPDDRRELVTRLKSLARTLEAMAE